MAIEHPRLLRRIEFAVVVITLIVMATGLLCLMFIAAGHAAKESDVELRRTLARLAWMSFALAALVFLVLAWLVIRYVSHYLRQRKAKPQPTPYLDAWALAGERFKLPPDTPETLADLGIGGHEDKREERGGDGDSREE